VRVSDFVILNASIGSILSHRSVVLIGAPVTAGIFEENNCNPLTCFDISRDGNVSLADIVAAFKEVRMLLESKMRPGLDKYAHASSIVDLLHLDISSLVFVVSKCSALYFNRCVFRSGQHDLTNLHRFVPITSGLVGPPSDKYPWDSASRRLDVLYLYLLSEDSPALKSFNSKFQDPDVGMDTLEPSQSASRDFPEAPNPKRVKSEKKEAASSSISIDFQNAVAAMNAANAPNPAVTAAQNCQLLLSLCQQIQTAQAAGLSDIVPILQNSLEYGRLY
jgi:hypothetical protein